MPATTNPKWVHPMFSPPGLGIREKIPVWFMEKQESWDFFKEAKIPELWIWKPLEFKVWDPSERRLVAVNQGLVEEVTAAIENAIPPELRETLKKSADNFVAEGVPHNIRILRKWDKSVITEWLESEKCKLNAIQEALPEWLRFVIMEEKDLTEKMEIKWPFAFRVGNHAIWSIMHIPLLRMEMRVPCRVTGKKEDQRMNPLGQWNGELRVEAEPLSDLGGLRYWVAVVPTVEAARLVLLATRPEVDLGSAGIVKLFAHGSVVEVMLPLPAAEIDPTWERLPYIVAAAKVNGLVYAAHRGKHESLRGEEQVDLGVG